jgi:hypothetical protein
LRIIGAVGFNHPMDACAKGRWKVPPASAF